MAKKKCDQCVALVINGVFCHETGCPNIKKEQNSGRIHKPGLGWFKP